MLCSHQHKHEVNETRTRSLAKAIFGRVIEIIIGGTIFGFVLTALGFQYAFTIGFGLNVIEELVCFVVTFVTERMWNRINWGRTVEDIEP